jgi:hypothetical protein
MTPEERNSVVKALAVVCEITGTSLSEAAQALVVKSLCAYPAPMVLQALTRCAQECKFKLTLADVISRLDDGRLGAETAWSLFPKSEDVAGLVTEEMSRAWGAAAPLYEAGDHVAARMAFKESYEAEVRRARAEGAPPLWRVSPGFNRASTESVAIDGYKRGLLTEKQATQYVLPEHLEAAAMGKALAPNKEGLAYVKRLVSHWSEPENEP